MSHRQESIPDYRLRISARAKKFRLNVHRDGSVEAVLPKTMDIQEAKELVYQYKDWILQKQAAILSEKEGVEEPQYPEIISFPAIHETFRVKYTEASCNSWECHDGHLSVCYQNESYIHKILQDWLKQQGKQYLPSMLADVAKDMQESYPSVSIRLQKTRWGSCSSQRRINLNAKLLLLPLPMIRSVLVHELAHLQHLNHSAQFWKRVEEFDLNYAENRHALRIAERKLPAWLE